MIDVPEVEPSDARLAELARAQQVREAVERAISEIIIPLIGSTITPVVVFLPLTLLTGVTGVFFNEPEAKAVVEAIEDFESRDWETAELRKHAEKFDQRVFAFRVLQFLGSVAPSSCASELIAGARLLSSDVSTRTWPRPRQQRKPVKMRDLQSTGRSIF